MSVPSHGMALTSPEIKPIATAGPTGIPSKINPRHRVRPTRKHSVNVPRKYLPMASSSRSRSVSDSSKRLQAGAFAGSRRLDSSSNRRGCGRRGGRSLFGRYIFARVLIRLKILEEFILNGGIPVVTGAVFQKQLPFLRIGGVASGVGIR